MPDTTKRLDLQFGSFACSVQGFDDPVQPVQQVLQALQNLLEETPALADAGISFDAEAIERLVGEVARRADIDEENVEIVPGLIIVHRRGDTAAGADPQAYDDGQDERGESWSRPFVAGAADTGDAEVPGASPGSEPADAEIPDDGREPGASADAGPGFINIFNPGAYGDAEAGGEPDSGLSGTTADSTDTDPPAAAEGVPEDEPGRDIFADTGESAGGSVFADPMAANAGAEPVDELTDQDEPINLFSAPDPADGSGDEPGNIENVFAGADPEDAGPEDTGEDAPEDPGEPDEDSERVETLFGRSEDQPEVVEADEGYTAAGLAQTAGAETVAELMVGATAWMVLIQGQTTFTRRDVFKVFDTMPGNHSKSLEARIKGFGKAVRDGQMIMVEDGVYGLSRTELERFQRLL